jgi:alginate O-acetyltransferase complex protein AlgJ
VATLWGMLDGPGTERQEREAPTPALPASLGALKAFAGAAKFYASERYALKDQFVSLNGAVKLGAFGHSPYPSVIVGKDGALFTGEDRAVATAMGAPVPAQASDAAWTALFEDMHAAFAATGVPIVQILAPDKHTVYADKLPDWLGPSDGARYTALLATLRTRLTPAPVDLLALFRAARAADPDAALYHMTDTHWNERGAALAINAALAGLAPVAAVPERFASVPVHGGDLSRMVGRQQAIRAIAPELTRPPRLDCRKTDGARFDIKTLDPLLPKRFTCLNPDAPGGHALVFADSFGTSATPRLVQIFSRIDFIGQDQVDPTIAGALHPDIAIRIMVGRKLQADDAARILKRTP